MQSKETLHKEPPPPKVQKSVPDNLTRVDYKFKEATLSEGPRPGERYDNQISVLIGKNIF